MTSEAVAYQDAWAGRPPRSDDERYRRSYEEGLADAKKAARRPVVNAAASKAAVGRARSRAQSNDFIWSGKAT